MGSCDLEVKGGSGIDIDGDKWTLLDNVHGDRPLKRSPYKQAEESMYYFKDKFNTEYHQQYRGPFLEQVLYSLSTHYHR